MVSKVAVIAIVAIFAVPILLGYAFNLTEETKTEYKQDGEAVNVTELLQTGTAYTTTLANVNQLNTDFEYNGITTWPKYSTSTTNTTFQMWQGSWAISPGSNQYWKFSEFDYEFYVYFGRDSSITFIELDPLGTTPIRTINHVVSLNYYANVEDHPTGGVNISYDGGSTFFYPSDTADYMFFRNDGATDATMYLSTVATPGTGTYYVDFAAGYHFEKIRRSETVHLNLPDKTRSTIMTIDLNSITDSDYAIQYSMGQVALNLTKTTVDGVAKWSVTNAYGGGSDTVVDELYYNPARSNNTYQIYYSLEYEGIYVSPYTNTTYYRFDNHVEFRYIGEWPTRIMAANYYLKYEYDSTEDHYYMPPYTFNEVKIRNLDNSNEMAKTIKMRMDSAEFSAFAYSIVSDVTYNPADFKSNPTTTLQVSKPGISLEFGGNVYSVDSSGNITLGTHKVSTNGMKLSSVPVAVGYENRINDTVISVTAQPSAITFNGQWGASVSTIANTSSTYKTTEWHAGSFGWDGLDHNFLMIGLLTSVGVFIALGLYVRRTKSSLWPLLVVCGGAVVLFFVML